MRFEAVKIGFLPKFVSTNYIHLKSSINIPIIAQDNPVHKK